MVPAMADPSSAVRSSSPSEIGRDVLVRCKAGDPVAFRAFVGRYERMVFALISRMLGRGPHVEDLAQDVFLRAFRGLPSFDLDGPAKPSTWLLTIATRAALDAKKRVVVATVPLDAVADLVGSATPESEQRRSELRASI